MTASIPNRRIYIQDVIDGDGAIDAERLLYVVNLFMESVYNISEKGTNIGEQVNADIFELSFTTPSDYIAINTFNEILFTPQLKGKRVQGVILCKIQDTSNPSKIFTTGVSLTWVETLDKIKITFITGLDDNKSYKLTILVI